MNWAALVWFVLLVVFILAEANSVALVSSWFAIGALVAMIASLFSAPLWLQLLLFFAISIVLLAALRPIVRKHFTPKLAKTNLDSIVGSTGLVTADICNNEGKGQVKLGAMDWTARSASGEDIPAGTLIKVDRIEGVKVFVFPAEVIVK